MFITESLLYRIIREEVSILLREDEESANQPDPESASHSSIWKSMNLQAMESFEDWVSFVESESGEDFTPWDEYGTPFNDVIEWDWPEKGSWIDGDQHGDKTFVPSQEGEEVINKRIVVAIGRYKIPGYFGDKLRSEPLIGRNTLPATGSESFIKARQSAARVGRGGAIADALNKIASKLGVAVEDIDKDYTSELEPLKGPADDDGTQSLIPRKSIVEREHEGPEESVSDDMEAFVFAEGEGRFYMYVLVISVSSPNKIRVESSENSSGTSKKDKPSGTQRDTPKDTEYRTLVTPGSGTLTILNHDVSLSSDGETILVSQSGSDEVFEYSTQAWRAQLGLPPMPFSVKWKSIKKVEGGLYLTPSRGESGVASEDQLSILTSNLGDTEITVPSEDGEEGEKLVFTRAH